MSPADADAAQKHDEIHVLAKADVSAGTLQLPRESPWAHTFAMRVTANGRTVTLKPVEHPHTDVALVNAAEFGMKHDATASARVRDTSNLKRAQRIWTSASARWSLVALLFGVAGCVVTGALAIGKVMDHPWLRLRPRHQAAWLFVAAGCQVLALFGAWFGAQFYKDEA